MSEEAKDIENYYTLCGNFNDDVEYVVTALSVLVKQSGRKVDKNHIRNNINNLYLRPYRVFLQRLVATPTEELSKYRLIEYSKLGFTILQLQTLIDNKVKVKRTKLLELRMLINKLIEINND